jgi:hypothetical protein
MGRFSKFVLAPLVGGVVTVAALVAQPAAADAPIQVPQRLTIGSTVRVPAPCRLGPTDRLKYEFDPLFQASTYYPATVDGPAAADGTIRLRVPAEAVPGRYSLQGTCEIVRPPGEVTSGTDQYARLDPAEVELVVASASARQGQPDFTG